MYLDHLITLLSHKIISIPDPIRTRSSSLPSAGVDLITGIFQCTVASTQAVLEISVVHAVKPLQPSAAMHFTLAPRALVHFTVLKHVLAVTIEHIACIQMLGIVLGQNMSAE